MITCDDSAIKNKPALAYISRLKFGAHKNASEIYIGQTCINTEIHR